MKCATTYLHLQLSTAVVRDQTAIFSAKISESRKIRRAEETLQMNKPVYLNAKFLMQELRNVRQLRVS